MGVLNSMNTIRKTLKKNLIFGIPNSRNKPSSSPIPSYSLMPAYSGCFKLIYKIIGIFLESTFQDPLPALIFAQNSTPPSILPEIQFVPDYGFGGAFSDPMLFTKPNRRGFSGDAWREFPKVEHQLIDWNESGRPLLNEPEMLGVSFRNAMPDHLPFVVDIPLKREAKPLGLEIASLAFRKTSELEIKGNLGKRLLVRTVTLPSLSHGKAIQRTQVRIGVNTDGYVVSAIVQRDLQRPDSLQAEADQRALDLIKGIRFEPNLKSKNRENIPSNRLEWGVAIFNWHPGVQSESPTENPVLPVPFIKQM